MLYKILKILPLAVEKYFPKEIKELSENATPSEIEEHNNLILQKQQEEESCVDLNEEDINLINKHKEFNGEYLTLNNQKRITKKYLIHILQNQPLSYSCYPFNPEMVEITKDDYNKLKLSKTHDLKYENNSIVATPKGENLVRKYNLEIEKLKIELASTDYKAIKYAEGLISEEDYLPFKNQRQFLRDEINRYRVLLESLN